MACNLTRLAAAALLPLTLTACAGANADTSGVASLTGASTSDDGAVAAVDSDRAMLDFAACMRENGIEDFPDPVVGEDGSLQFGFFGSGPGGGGGPGAGGATGDGNQPDRDQFEALRETRETAQEACGDILEGLDLGGPGGPGGGDFEFDSEAFLEYAECMRENGVDDFPDPGPDGRPDFEQMQALDFQSSTFQDAQEACADVGGFGGGGFGGPGGGGPGAPGGPPPGSGDGQ